MKYPLDCGRFRPISLSNCGRFVIAVKLWSRGRREREYESKKDAEARQGSIPWQHVSTPLRSCAAGYTRIEDCYCAGDKDTISAPSAVRSSKVLPLML